MNIRKDLVFRRQFFINIINQIVISMSKSSLIRKMLRVRSRMNAGEELDIDEAK